METVSSGLKRKRTIHFIRAQLYDCVVGPDKKWGKGHAVYSKTYLLNKIKYSNKEQSM